MQNILITGLATLDLIFKLDKFPVKNEKYRAETAAFSGGGNAGNSSVAVSRLGANTTIFSSVGKKPEATVTAIDQALGFINWNKEAS